MLRSLPLLPDLSQTRFPRRLCSFPPMLRRRPTTPHPPPRPTTCSSTPCATSPLRCPPSAPPTSSSNQRRAKPSPARCAGFTSFFLFFCLFYIKPAAPPHAPGILSLGPLLNCSLLEYVLTADDTPTTSAQSSLQHSRPQPMYQHQHHPDGWNRSREGSTGSTQSSGACMSPSVFVIVLSFFSCLLFFLQCAYIH